MSGGTVCAARTSPPPGAAIRAIRRIGHCYGYPLATERDRHYVMGVLELAMADEPEVRQSIRPRLYLLMHDPKTAPLELRGVGLALAEDFVIGSVPVLGEVAAVVLDYAFMRRIDIASRRVFQERWLRRRGKVLVIPPAEAGLRSKSLSVAWESSRGGPLPRWFRAGIRGDTPRWLPPGGCWSDRCLCPRSEVRRTGARDAVASVDRMCENPGAVAPLPAPQLAP